MMRKAILLTASIGLLLLSSCSKEKDLYQQPQDETNNESNAADQIQQNVLNTFGVSFPSDQDWSTTVKSSVTVTADADLKNIVKVQILTQSPFGNPDAKVLNEAEATNGQTVELYFDVPSSLTRLYAACVSKSGQYYVKGFKVGTKSVSFTSTASARRKTMSQSILSQINALPQPTISSIEDSYAKERGYEGFDNCLLYLMGDRDVYKEQIISMTDYDDDSKEDLKDIILTYLPNKVSNIEKIRGSAYYNESSYPITTGGNDPVVLSPIYKDDGGWKEVEECDIYYYYFKDEDIKYMSADEQVLYFKSLPKYKAIDLMNSVASGGKSTGMKDKELKKNTAYTLIYWGDEEHPTTGATGTFVFPAGYRIGFMLRNNGPKVENGIYVHRGELYCDGRLNKEVNKWGHLASAKLGDTDARMAWLAANNKMFLCCESGTDRDFNDVVFEIEGGIDPFVAMPTVENNSYTYLYEDTQLGDYDMNDIVIKAKRLNSTTVEYSIVACGAYDAICVRNINQGAIKDDVEVHSLFNVDQHTFINTQQGQSTTPITVKKTVAKTFSFTDPETQPYIYNQSKDLEVRIAKKGEDPHGIMVPNDFRYPLEKVCIKDAYSEFNNWGQNPINSTDWYLTPNEGKVY